MKLPEPVAHIYPSTLEKFEESETFGHCYSIAVGSPDEESVEVYTEAQYLQGQREALEAAAKLIEGTEMSGLQSHPQMQIFIAQLLSGYVTAIRKLKEGL